MTNVLPDSENVVVLILHTLPISAASSVPSSATFLGVRADLDGIVAKKPVQTISGAADEDEVSRLANCGLLRAVVDLVLWERALVACPTNSARLAALARLFTSGLSDAAGDGGAGNSAGGANGVSQGQMGQSHPKQASKSLSFGAKVKDL